MDTKKMLKGEVIAYCTKCGGYLPNKRTEEVMEDKLDMTLTLTVKGKEVTEMTLKYMGTTMETVHAVEEALADMVKALNAKK